MNQHKTKNSLVIATGTKVAKPLNCKSMPIKCAKSFESSNVVSPSISAPVIESSKVNKPKLLSQPKLYFRLCPNLATNDLDKSIKALSELEINGEKILNTSFIDNNDDSGCVIPSSLDNTEGEFWDEKINESNEIDSDLEWIEEDLINVSMPNIPDFDFEKVDPAASLSVDCIELPNQQEISEGLSKDPNCKRDESRMLQAACYAFNVQPTPVQTVPSPETDATTETTSAEKSETISSNVLTINRPNDSPKKLNIGTENKSRIPLPTLSKRPMKYNPTQKNVANVSKDDVNKITTETPKDSRGAGVGPLKQVPKTLTKVVPKGPPKMIQKDQQNVQKGHQEIKKAPIKVVNKATPKEGPKSSQDVRKVPPKAVAKNPTQPRSNESPVVHNIKNEPTRSNLTNLPCIRGRGKRP